MQMHTDSQSNLDVALIINRYKNAIKVALQSLLLENHISINFNDSLFNFFNKICIFSIEYANHIDHIKKINGNDQYQEVYKLLYSNNVNLFITSELVNISQITNIIKENYEKIACIRVLQEYYGPFVKYTFTEKITTNNFTLLLSLTQDSQESLTTELLQLYKITNNNNNNNNNKNNNNDNMRSIIVNNIDWRYLFTNLEQLENIVNNFSLLTSNNIKRFVVIFDYILNNSLLINLNFFTMPKNNEQHINRVLELCFNINILANNNNKCYKNYNYPKEEFNKRLHEFITHIISNTEYNKNLIKNFVNQSNNIKNDVTRLIHNVNINDNTYFEALRDVDLDNKSVIYNYSINKNKQTKCNNELYKTIKFRGVTSNNDRCKPYNNFIRDIAYKFSVTYNKQLLHNLDKINVYFTIPQTEYVSDILYAKPGTILTLVTNIMTTYESPNINSFDHIIKVHLEWNNIFLILNNYGDNGIILPYGTQLRLDSIIQILQKKESPYDIILGNYAISATPINTLSLLPQLNINTFIQTSRIY